MLPDQETFEFGQAKLRTKKSLEFTQRNSGGDVWYMVEDEATGRFFRIGVPEYTFLSLLNGQRTVQVALMRMATLLKQHALDDRQAANLCRWAIESGLMETELSNSSSRREEKDRRDFFDRTMSWINPVTLKIPLFNPDRIITAVAGKFGWLVSPGGLILWLMVCMYGFGLLLMNWQRFVQGQISSISVFDTWYFVVSWMVLKLIHEMAHGVVCKKYRGEVRSSGILLLLMIPLPYVDVSSSWRFESKWKRILTAAAGIVAELFIAAIACCIWVWSGPGPIQFHAGNVIITATLSTILFNINPLMRFDGYYILSDWLDIPNLSTHGRQYFKGFFKRLYFGQKFSGVKDVGWRGIVVRLYGFAAALWFVLIAVGLTLGASNIVEGVGLLVVLISLSMWFVLPIFQLIKYVCIGTPLEQPNRIWFVSALAITVAFFGAVLFLVPAPTVMTAPCVVDFKPHKVVRSGSSGFANEIHVENGQYVSKGDLLVTLENPQLQAEYQALIIDIRISKLRINSLLNAEEIALLQLERENLQALDNRRLELESLLGQLDVVSISDGLVLGLELFDKLGTYVRPGDELLSIGDPEQLQVIAMADQDDVQWLEKRKMDNVKLLIWGRSNDSLIDGQMVSMEPRVRDDLPHPAFAAANGGPLSVVPRQEVGDDGGVVADDDQWVLVEPKVAIQIGLGDSEKSELLAGQLGVMMVHGRDENLGSYLANQIIRFVRHNNLRTHGL